MCQLYRLAACWLPKSLHVLVIGDLLDGRLTLWIKLANVPRGVHLGQVNALLSLKNTLPHDLFGFLQVDGQKAPFLVHAPHRVVHLDLVEKGPIEQHLEH